MDPFLWPLLWLEIRDNWYIGGTENLDVVLPLIRYVDFQSAYEKEYNLDKLKKAYRQK